MTRLIKKLSEPKSFLLIGIFYTVGITVAFLYPAAKIPSIQIPYADKLIHILIHWMLLLIWLRYTALTDRYHSLNKIVVVVLVICFSYGIVIEALQHWFTHSRTFDLLDIVANGIGSLFALLSFKILRDKKLN